jgi:hypothetical protein
MQVKYYSTLHSVICNLQSAIALRRSLSGFGVCFRASERNAEKLGFHTPGLCLA